MTDSSGSVSPVAASPQTGKSGRREEPAPPPARSEAPPPTPFGDTPAYQAAARQPADLAIIPAETGPKLIYVFRDPVTGETIRQYPTQSTIAAAGERVDTEI